MKIYKIVLFILITIALLALVCIFFPKDGVKIGSFTLRFAGLENVLTNKSQEVMEAEVKEAEEIRRERIQREAELAAEQDSAKRQQELLALYEQAMQEHVSRIYYPNDDYNYFNQFFASAAAARGDGRTIRVLHYGDSQIELDRFSSTLRRYFQGLFGGGGPGLLPAVQSCPTSTVSQWASENFTQYATYGTGSRDKSGQYGLMSKCFRVNGSATCSFSRTRTSRVRVLVNDLSTGFSVTLKGDEVEEVRTCDSIGGFQILEWNLPSSLSSFKLAFSGKADIHGILLDAGGGVAVDNIAMRGNSGTDFTKINSQLLRDTYKQINVRMIILQYGGNAMPAVSSKKAVENYAASIGRQIKYLQAVCPNTPILFIGPSDMSTVVNGIRQSYPLMEDMVEELKKTALENGAAFWNMYEVMGGKNSMLSWVNKGLAGQDYVHFSPAGAEKISDYLKEAFETAYKHYQIGNGISVDMPEKQE